MALKVGELYYDITADTGKLVGQSREVERETGRMVASLTAVAIAVKALAIAYTLLKSAQLAEDMRMLFARVQVAAGGIDNTAKAMRGLQEISTRTQTSIEANARVFVRLNASLLQMGGTQEDTLRLTDLLAKAIRVSGGTAQEASSAMLQFGQALGSGRLAGDEFKSLMENAPFLMKQLAAGLGEPIGALKALAADGKLTADVVVEALGKAAGQIDADFKQLPQTMNGAMQVAQAAAARLAEKLDDVSGVSAVLTGVTSGLGTTLDLLAESFSGSSREADKLGRSDTVKTWANATTTALSYVVDAADVVTRGFRQIGTAIGGSAAAAAAVARGELKQAASIMAAMKDDVLAIGAADFRGAGIRARVDAQPAGSSIASTFSKLKAPAVAGKAGRGGRADSFDSAGYLAGLERTTLEGVALVDAAEKEALRKNAELLTQRKINADTSAQAITLIERNAAQERGDIRQREADQAADIAQRSADAEDRRAQQEAESRARGLKMAQDAAVINDPVAQLELRLVRESELLTQYAMQDAANAQLYAQARVALEQETALQIAEVRERAAQQQMQMQMQAVGMAVGVAGQLLDIERNAGRDRSALAKAMFLVQKAFAVAEIIINTEVAATKAGAQLGIFGIPMAAMIRVSGYASAGLVAGMAIGQVAGGRQYGGPVSAGEMYRVNESGRPEMFTSANGAQYMMPTANGDVTPAGRTGGSGGDVFNITQHFAIQPGTNEQTQQQMAAAAARGLQLASARNN